MADTSGFITGDDFIGFDAPSPGSPSRSVSDFNPSDAQTTPYDTDFRDSPGPAAGRGSDSEPKGKKRKSDGGVPLAKRPNYGEPYTGPRNLKEEKRAAERAAPWADAVHWYRFDHPSMMLSEEIHAFYKYMAPTPAEIRVRSNIIDLITNTIRNSWRTAETVPFGSWQTGLYLPTGDIDLVVANPGLNANNKVRLLRQLASIIRSKGITNDVAVISRARVPIIKFVTTEGKINVDISLCATTDMANGVQSGHIIRHYLDSLPGARELILVVKAFLAQRSMNEVYTGGIGSYSVICLVISFMQMHPKLRRSEMDPLENLGVLLVEFFELYGRNFSFDTVGISIRRGGSYFSKARRGWNIESQRFLMSIEDPQNPENDISKGSHGIRQVRLTLSGAYDLLTAALFQRWEVIDRHEHEQYGPGRTESSENMSLLASIMGVTKETRKFRHNMEAVDAEGVLQRKVDELIRTMGKNAVRVPRAYEKHCDGRKDRNPEADTKGKGRAEPRTDTRRTPPPPVRSTDPVNAIILDGNDEGIVQQMLNEVSDSDSGDSDVRYTGSSAPQSRFASVSQDSVEEGEIRHDAEEGEVNDSRYDVHGKNGQKNKRRQRRKWTKELAEEKRQKRENNAKKDEEAGKKEAPQKEPSKKSKKKKKNKANKTASHGPSTGPNSSAAPSPSGKDSKAGLTAHDRKAFWAAKGGVKEDPVDMD